MTMAQAMGAEMDFSVEDENNAYMKDWVNSYLKPNLSATKVCYNTNGCWNNGHTKLKDGTIDYFSREGIGVGYNIITAVLNDGSFINIDAYRKNDIKNKFGVNIKDEYGLIFYFDINGAREPNTIGSDIFAVVYKNGTIVPAFSDRTKAQIEADCSSTGSGRACILKYLKQ